MSFPVFASTVSFLPLLLAAFFVLLKWNIMMKKLPYFMGFLLFSFVIQLVSAILFFMNWNNMLLLHLNTLVGGILLILFYQNQLANFLSINRIVLFGYACSTLVDILFFGGVFQFGWVSLTIQAILMIVLSLTSYITKLEGINKNLKPSSTEFIWINSGIFIYFTTNLLLYYYSDHLMQNVFKGNSFMNVWLLHALSTFTAYSLFLAGIIIASRLDKELK